ncbi:MAB_1171c family putative transporter [Streptomyces violascens]|uniref:MAB_1171c family putative transporter n=1 Tax=Streptomyces violascens TaxID=67381 RepID=UPI001675F71D|nr:MAB_1171c family putative transporter [Streptomyces violascens]GGU38113.1 hypothetical protein GCM10010289_68850 [Streptomyces violascens]
MSEDASNIVYLAISVITLAIAAWKALALRRDPTTTLALTTSMLFCATLVYVMASPVGYRTLGDWTGQPSFATLPVYVGILACFALVHLITLLWDSALLEVPKRRRNLVTAWSVGYVASGCLMVAAFAAADLSGPADPLKFNTAFTDDPFVLIFLAVFLATLTSGTLNTYRQCRRAEVSDPGLQHSLAAFGYAMLVIFGYVVCSVPAIVAAVCGSHALDTVGVFGSSFGAFGCIIMCYGLSGSAVGAWLRERRDYTTLQPLWELVVGQVDDDLAFNPDSTPGQGGKLPANVSFNLHRRVIEILDGIRTLRPWVSQDVIDDVRRSASDLTEADREALAAAVALQEAVQQLHIAREEFAQRSRPDIAPPEGPPVVLPGEKTPASEERERLLRLARSLDHPLAERSREGTEARPAA